LDFRLAEYQARAMLGLVEDGLWEREKLLNMVSYQVEDVDGELVSLMTERVLTKLLEEMPEDPALLSYLEDLRQRNDYYEQAGTAGKYTPRGNCRSVSAL
jgi:hypothetical protein